jgi:hypothetical protein
MKIKLCNVHKLAVANEGEERKPIFIPFGTWPYDDTISQTLDRPHAEGIAADLDKQIAAGEPGIPVYQGHPDVPEYAGKYPDKGAMGWVKKILVNEDGMECQIEWDRDPGKGFGWFSPYWIGDKPVVGPDGKKNVIVDGLTSIGLVNNPNIREFRLANEAQLEERKPMKPYELPEHIAALAKKFDERRAMANVVDANGMGHSDENGQFDGSGSGGGSGKGTFNPKGKKDDAASKKLNELYDKWSAEDDKDENSSATKAALKEYTDYRSKLESSGMRVGVRDQKEGIVALRDEPGSGGGSGGGGATRPRDEKGPRASINGDSKYAATIMRQIAQGGHINGRYSPTAANKALDMIREDRAARRAGYTGVGGDAKSDAEARKSVHLAAICMGLKYNYKTHKYE